MNTAKVKRLLFEAMDKPNKKRMTALASEVIAVCDALDEQNTLSAVIKVGNDSLDHSLDILQKLHKQLR
jgi:hypothetical protein